MIIHISDDVKPISTSVNTPVSGSSAAPARWLYKGRVDRAKTMFSCPKMPLQRGSPKAQGKGNLLPHGFYSIPELRHPGSGGLFGGDKRTIP